MSTQGRREGVDILSSSSSSIFFISGSDAHKIRTNYYIGYKKYYIKEEDIAKQ